MRFSLRNRTFLTLVLVLVLGSAGAFLMARADWESRQTIVNALIGFGVGSALTAALAELFGRHASRRVLRPIRDGSQTTALHPAGTRLQLLDEIKSNDVASVSHKLTAPLANVQLTIHLLLEEAAGPLTAKQVELLTDARDYVELLRARVNNLLHLACMEQGREHFEIQPEQPADLLQSAVDVIRREAEEKEVELVVETPADLPAVAADALRLQHALAHLLENAVTYTHRGGRITLEAAPADHGVTFSVADTGIGIPPEYLPHVFDRFFRVPGQSRGSGTGLGLAIVREIITCHGGTITCESSPAAGTVFRFTLPAWVETPAARLTPIGNGAAAARKA